VRTDPLDVDLVDAEFAEEIRLVVEVMVAAATRPGRLRQDDVDEALGIRPDPAGCSLPVQGRRP
jgi:hypothetical protein